VETFISTFGDAFDSANISTLNIAFDTAEQSTKRDSVVTTELSANCFAESSANYITNNTTVDKSYCTTFISANKST